MKAATIFALLVPVACSAQTIGLHTVTVHEHGGTLQTPGLYLRTAPGFTVGTLKNCLGDRSRYAGWTLERGPFALTVGAIDGYKQTGREVWPLVVPSLRVGPARLILLPPIPPRKDGRTGMGWGLSFALEAKL